MSASIALIGSAGVASAAGHGYGGGEGEGEGGHGHGGGRYDVVDVISASTAAVNANFRYQELDCTVSIAAGTFAAPTQVVVEHSYVKFSSVGASSSASLAVASFLPHSNVVVTPLHPISVTCASHEFSPASFSVTYGANAWSVVAGPTGHTLSVAVTGPTPFAFATGRGDDLLSVGSHGREVVLAQILLKLWGYPVTVNGSFTAATASALSAFQTAQGVAVTGTTTLATWYLLELK